MIIERTTKEVIIRLSPDINTEELQKMVNFARYKEITAKFKVSQNDVDTLINDIKKDWHKKK
jgi:TATA-binding protein-associated factor Taf7